MKVPFINLRIKHENHKSAFEKGLKECIDTNNFILGKKVKEFEEAFAKFVGTKYAVGVASGTDALHLSLRAADVGAGDEVLVPSMTFAATSLAVLYAGARPVAVDVHEQSGLINLDDAQKAISPKTKAIIPVHIFGHPCDMEAIMSFAKKNNLVVIEDACQAHGATLKDRRTGSFGLAGCFSFYPGKNLGALGDGGLVTTDDEATYKKLLMLRNYGQSVRYQHDVFGFNSRLDPVQASFLNEKLKFLDKDNEQRRRHADFYRKNLKGLPLTLMQEASEKEKPVYHLFVIRTPLRAKLAEYLQEKGIETGIHYPVPIHKHKFMVSQAGPCRDCPSAQKLADDVMSLPMFPELSQPELEFVVAGVKEFFNEKQGESKK